MDNMKQPEHQPQKKKVRRRIILPAVFFFAVIVLFLLPACGSQKDQRLQTDLTAIRTADKGKGSAEPQSAGSIPTEIPSATPVPLEGMDSPLFCKMELVNLTNKAKKLGAGGMLVLDQYDIAKDSCRFTIRNTAAFGNLGTIVLNHHMDTGDYGITLKIDSTKEDQVRLWAKTALLFFNNGIDEKTAEAAIEEALAGTKVKSELFVMTASGDVSIDGGTVTPLRRIEITNTVSAF